MSLKVIGIGEALWDLLPSGPQLGGAPANFAYHASSLGAEARVITRVGNDQLGREIYQRFTQMGLADGTGQVDPTAPTGTVTVTLNGNGVPQFVIQENVAWDRLEVTPAALKAAREANAVCFGSLAQRNPVSRAAIQRLVAATPAGALRVFDINLRQRFFSREVIEQSLHLTNVLKLNESELPVLAGLLGLSGEPRQQLEQLGHNYELRLVVLTRGENGSLVYQQGQWSEEKPARVNVVDTVGAGDAFTAALVMGVLQEWELDEVHAFAAEVARYVCSCAGATPSLPEPLRRRSYLSPATRHAGPKARPAVQV